MPKRFLLPVLMLGCLAISSNALLFNGNTSRRSRYYYSTHFDRTNSELESTSVSSQDNNTQKGAASAPNKKNKNARYVAAMALISSKKNEESFALRRLENDQDFLRLEERDRRFARNLVSTVERRKGQLDKVLAFCVDQKLQKPRRKADAMVLAALRVGAAQLLFLETPPHAALKETVDVLRMNPRIKVPEPKIKFVNAVLRRIGKEQVNNNVLESETSAYDNIAPWLLKDWRKAWGEDKLAAIAEAAMAESPIYISVNQPLGSSPEEKLQKLQTLKEAFDKSAEDFHDLQSPTEILRHGSIHIDKASFPGAVSKWPLYNEGEWWVQDASAALPAIALYNSLLAQGNDNLQQDQSIVDLCAAPGGKTAQLLSLGFPSVKAVEQSPRRAKQLKSNLARLQLEDRCQVVVADGCDWIPPEGPESVAGVLLDVPCSATGTASRRPDVLQRDQTLESLLETQYSLAKHCVDNLLESGGIMVYATCSLLKQESEDQVRKLLERKDGAHLKLVPFSPGEILGFDETIDELGCLRVIPGWLPGKLCACDGFFVARFQKR